MILTSIGFILLSACVNPLYTVSSAPTAEMMRADVEYLADDARMGRQVGTEGERASAVYIADRMRSIGLQPWGDHGGYLQRFDFKHDPHMAMTGAQSGIGYNVLGMLDNHQPSTIVVGAHFDHLGMGGFGSLHAGDQEVHNGADDNASGVAVMLEVARQLASAQDLHSNVLFIAFSGEELGLLGSNAFVKSPIAASLSMKCMINMDMVGRYQSDKGIRVGGVGSSPVWDIVLDEVDHQGLKIILSESGTGPSDHSSFYYADVPVLSLFTGQHEDYHKPSDDHEKLNYRAMSDIAAYTTTIIRLADEFSDMPFEKTEETEQEKMTFKVTLGVMPDYLYDGGGMRLDGVNADRPAHHAGLLKGDIIKYMDGVEIKDIYGYMEQLNKHEKGDKCLITIERDGQLMEKTVVF